MTHLMTARRAKKPLKLIAMGATIDIMQQFMIYMQLVRRLFVGVLVLSLFGCTSIAPSLPSIDDTSLQHALEARLLSDPEWSAFRSAYLQRDFHPLWLDGGTLNKRGRIVLEHFIESWREGLTPDNYDIVAIQAAVNGKEVTDRIKAELLLSKSLRQYITNMEGSSDGFTSAVTAVDLAAYLDALVPADSTYQALRATLNHYRSIASQGGWGEVPSGPLLEPGGMDERIPDVEKRLAIENLQFTVDPSGLVYSVELIEEVRNFQARQGLDVDGIIGPETLAAFNVSAKQRAETIQRNLRRFRKHLKEVDPTAVVVNVPAAELSMTENNSEIFHSRVIVGSRDWPTPLFKSVITEIELNPYWNVPPRIARLEMLPRIKREPSYLSQQGIRVLEGWSKDTAELDPNKIDWRAIRGEVPFRLRQDPGLLNPLGEVKFLFANPYHVYLHDTPKRNLFDLAKRRLSHGCIRVDQAMNLAEKLLAPDPAWSPEALATAVASGETLRIRLIRPVPLYLINLTAWADAEGKVHFRPESYVDEKTGEQSGSGTVN